MVNPIDELFPSLAGSGYSVTSPVDKRYNCIAHAAGDSAIWWWPLPANLKDVYWPASVPREETIAAFREMFVSLGYAECLNADLETGVEKVALFANELKFPLHAARQLSSGRWTSKLGERVDIEHELHELEGDLYGKVVLIMKRLART